MMEILVGGTRRSMPGFEIKNLFQLPHIIKLPELVFAFITLIIGRAGNDGDPSGVACGDVDGLYDDLSFAYMVIYGFFFFLLLQIISIVFGDKPTVLNVLTALCGFIFYLAVGGNLLHCKYLGSVEKGFGAMSILTGFIFGADTVISVLKLRK